MAQFEYDMDKNDISFIRFGNTGAAGSESWMKGSKMKPYQIKKLKELLRSVEGADVKPENTPNLENMFE
jgi:hypothetical protein